MKTNTYVEYAGKQVDERTVVTNVKQEWTKAGNKIKDIQTMNLYVKPEENKVYYVINEVFSGAVIM